MTVHEVKKRLEALRYRILHNVFCNKVHNAELEALNLAIECMEEVEQYRALGTVEEMKEAREKQIPKKPRTDDEDWLCCRNCGETFSLVNTLHKRNKYCGNCGTKIDWSEVGGINGNKRT